MSDGRIFGGLGTSDGFFAVAVHVVVDGAIQAESTKLDGSPVNLVAVSGHANSFALIEHAASMVNGCASRRLCGGTSPASLVLLLRSRERSARRTGSRTPRVPGISSFAGSSFSHRGVRVILDLVKVCFGELVIGRRQSNLGHDNVGNGWDCGDDGDGRSDAFSRGSRSCLLFWFGDGLLDRGGRFGFGLSRLGRGQGLDDRLGGL